MHTVKIYLGSPIDTSKSRDPGSHFDDLAQICRDAFDERPFVAYNPMTAFRIYDPGTLNGDDVIAEYLNSVNNQALKTADIAVFYLDDSPSFGVPVEIYQSCEEYHHPTFVWWASKKKKPGYLIKALPGVVVVTADYLLRDELTSFLESLEDEHAKLAVSSRPDHTT